MEIESVDLSGVDWNRHSIGIGPSLKDEQQQAVLKTVHFSQVEMKILRVLLTRDMPTGEGTVVLAQEYPGLGKLAILLAAWETWSKERGCP